MNLDAALETHPPPRWAAIGLALAAAGLTERAVRTCFGVAAVAHVPRAIAAGRRWDTRPPPAAVAPWLLAGGGAVADDLALRVLGNALDDLVAAGLVARDDGEARARVLLIPCGAAITLCDRDDATGDDVVSHPDDSSHHLLNALPRRPPARWLDLGTGPAWAPLAAPWRADLVVGADVNPRAIAMARLGAALAGLDLDLRVADLAAGIPGRFDLVTCNAPIPAGRGEAGPRHRVSPRGDELLSRLWAALPALVAPGGEAIVHSALDDEPLAATAHLAGEVVIARYTPAGVPGFGVTAWRPGGTPDRRVVEVTLTAAAPHVPRAVLDAPA